MPCGSLSRLCAALALVTGLLASAERAYLAAHGPIRYAPDPSFAPFESSDAEGRAVGITPDLLTLMGRGLGVEFRSVRYPTWSAVLAAARRGDVDLLGTLTRTPEREAFLRFSRPYLSVPCVLTHLHQILVNLGTNARYAMRETGGVLTVSLERVAVDGRGHGVPAGLAAGRHARLAVCDTGPGIDAAVRQRTFEPYFTTKPVGEGSGLGLAVVHGIVTGLGGAIAVDSEPSRAVTFKVFLPPLAEGDAPAVAGAARQALDAYSDPAPPGMRGAG